MKIKKYLTLARASLQSSLAYRFDSLLWGMSELVGTLFFLFIWAKIFGEGQTVAGFTLPETITYLIGTGFVANLISVWVNRDLERDVQQGRLSTVLVRPMSYFWARVATNFAEKPLNLSIRLGVFFVVAFAFKSRLILNQGWKLFFLCGLSIIFAAAINFLVNFLLGCLAFWLTRTRGVFGFFRPVQSVLSGGYAPLTFFPGWFQKMAGLLPFSSTRYFPLLIYLGKVNGGEIVKGLLVQVFWIVSLSLAARFVWRRGLKKYEGVGI